MRDIFRIDVKIEERCDGYYITHPDESRHQTDYLLEFDDTGKTGWFNSNKMAIFVSNDTFNADHTLALVLRKYTDSDEYNMLEIAAIEVLDGDLVLQSFSRMKESKIDEWVEIFNTLNRTIGLDPFSLMAQHQERHGV